MEKKEIETKIRVIIVETLGCKNEEIKLESSFTNDLGANSLDIIELTMEFEKNFNLNIPHHITESLKTVKDVIIYVTENKK